MLDIAAQNGPMLEELCKAAERVIRSGRYILGPEVDSFESEVAAAIGVEHAIGVSSGTDALLVALMALDIGHGDEVITTPFSFFATAGCIARVGAKPVFVDIDADTFNIDSSAIEAAITPHTKAIMPVHLFGQPCDMKAISSIAKKHGLKVIEDAAQAIGAKSPDGRVGGLGEYACFSFFPSKNLGGFGDGGLVTTNDAELAERARVIRVHGSKPKYFHHVVGGNFRLDPLQAALLRVKLPMLSQWAEGRLENADAYTSLFADAGLEDSELKMPVRRFEGHVYNQYVIRVQNRDALQAYLAEADIASAIYYPLCLHQQTCFADLGYQPGSMPVAERAASEVLALPVFPGLSVSDKKRIVDTITSFIGA